MHPHATDQTRVCAKTEIQPRTVTSGERGWEAAFTGGAQRRHTFNARTAANHVELHEPLQLIKDSNIAARLLGDERVDSLADAGFVQNTIELSGPEEAFSVAPGLFGGLHRKWMCADYAANCRFVSSASRRWSSGLRTFPVTRPVVSTTRRPTSRLSSVSMRVCSAVAASRALTTICSAAAMAF